MSFVRSLWALPLVIVLALVATGRDADAQSCPVKSKYNYKVKIDSAPQGATVYLGARECGAVGTTPYTASVPAGTYTVIFDAPGYEPGQRSFKVAKLRTVQELFMPLVKKPDPPKLEVRADADKNIFGAQVSLDGQPKGQVPVTLETTPGRHLLEIRKEGFETYTQWIEANVNQIQTIAPTLKEIAKPKFGTIIVNADVADAEIFIDGKATGLSTPQKDIKLSAGKHKVTLVNNEFGITEKFVVEIKADQVEKQIKDYSDRLPK